MVSVDETPRGLACGAVCPACQAPLSARQGKVNEHHFAHSVGAECATALETSLHRMAKQVLAEIKQLALPALTAEGHATGPDGVGESVQYVHRKARVVAFDEVVLEVREGSIIPDARCTLGGHVCYVEFWVTHASTVEKRAELARRGVAAVEVRLRPDPALASVDGVQKALCGSVEDREWLWHPRAAEAKEIACKRAEAQSARYAARRAEAESVRFAPWSAGERRRATTKLRRKQEIMVPRPPKAATPASSRAVHLRCEACGYVSKWANGLPPNHEPPCPSCGHAVGRDVITLG